MVSETVRPTDDTPLLTTFIQLARTAPELVTFPLPAKAARRRKFDTLIVWRLDRLGRNLRHLIMLLDELTALGVGFVSLGEGIDTSTPAGRLQLHMATPPS